MKHYNDTTTPHGHGKEGGTGPGGGGPAQKQKAEVPGGQERSRDTAGHSSLSPTTWGDALEDLSIACDVTPNELFSSAVGGRSGSGPVEPVEDVVRTSTTVARSAEKTPPSSTGREACQQNRCPCPVLQLSNSRSDRVRRVLRAS